MIAMPTPKCRQITPQALIKGLCLTDDHSFGKVTAHEGPDAKTGCGAPSVVSPIINREADLAVCGEAEDRHEAVAAIASKQPDLAIIDLTLKNSDDL